MMRSGLLLIDKPEGPSSAHVVHRVKMLLGAKKVGHLGTLDPFASGLLLIGVNEGTKIADIFLSAPEELSRHDGSRRGYRFARLHRHM